MKPDISRIFGTISRLILEPRSTAFRWGFAVLSFAVALALRWVVDDQLQDGFPFLTFFPAVVMTAFFCGILPGVVVAVASFAASWTLFISEPGTLDMSAQALTAMAFFTFITVTDVVLIAIMSRAIRHLDEERNRSAAMAEQGRLMFNELQHRVSNNLATVAGLLTIQRRAVKDETARKALDDAAARINVVARMKRLLHDPTAQEVDFAAFLRDMTHEVIAAAGVEERVHVHLECARIAIPRDRAIPLGLITTELLSNAIEHAFGAGEEGHVEIVLRRNGTKVVLRIADDGHGLPAGFVLEETRSLGLSIARQFALQIDGELVMKNRAPKGAVSELVFPAV
ncbi:sensor histidine kinase [Falsirhodobacter algicola]|uniref:histidine kinase n=1 Tax=Falsirhodobacter algicola TaxID=2692330 RepID=A0A8J8MSY6_9RHOB|nr:histidine kinase dimerization/phosphoacceptor domain -containing protein [Falsirhodobacter algicola]QUS35738.1 DUF4118 domain-containing protein [Falsirhodobacter algicola]